MGYIYATKLWEGLHIEYGYTIRRECFEEILTKPGLASFDLIQPTWKCYQANKN